MQLGLYELPTGIANGGRSSGPNADRYVDQFRARMTAAASRLDMHPTGIGVATDADPDVIVGELRKARIEVADFLFSVSREIAEGLIRNRVAASFQDVGSVKAGGVLSYSEKGELRIALRLAARILQGAAVATLPAEQVLEFHMALNLRTARALGLTVSQSMLVQANEVFE